jgi:transposase InsO family protein
LLRIFFLCALARCCSQTIFPNLTKDLTTTRPNQVWRTDFTHLNYRGILFYLATIIDDFTKEILGYVIGRNHSQEFVLEALKDAIRKTNTISDMLHSDQGSEYRSFLFLEFLLKNNIKISMSTKSSPWQNG